jgi:hypothetical protein
MKSIFSQLMEKSSGEAEPKSLRVGVDTARTAQAALAALLIEKGVFTVEEYTATQAAAIEEEHHRFMTWRQESA